MYDLYDLGTLPGDTVSAASAINASHEVAGISAPSNDVNAPVHGFHWSNGIMTDIGSLGGPVTRVFAMNASSVIVGTSHDKSGVSRAFRWTKKYGMVDLGLDRAWPSVAVSINDAGVIVGGSGQKPFYRDAQGNFVDLPQNVARDGGSSFLTGAAAVNAAGCMTGQADDGNRTYFWNPLQPDTAKFTPVPPFWSTPQGINSHNLIVGAEEGSVWIPDLLSESQSPPYHLKPFTVGSPYYARAVNDSGTIVGGSFSDATDRTAIVWFSPSPVTLPTDLNLLVSSLGNEHLESASDINNLGSIVGEGTFSGHAHAYLAKMPEPAFNFHIYGTFVKVVSGSAGGSVIGVTLDGRVIHFPEPNPILRSMKNVFETLGRIRNPTQREALGRELAEVIDKRIKNHEIR